MWPPGGQSHHPSLRAGMVSLQPETQHSCSVGGLWGLLSLMTWARRAGGHPHCMQLAQGDLEKVYPSWILKHLWGPTTSTCSPKKDKSTPANTYTHINQLTKKTQMAPMHVVPGWMIPCFWTAVFLFFWQMGHAHDIINTAFHHPLGKSFCFSSLLHQKQ